MYVACYFFLRTGDFLRSSFVCVCLALVVIDKQGALAVPCVPSHFHVTGGLICSHYR